MTGHYTVDVASKPPDDEVMLWSVSDSIFDSAAAADDVTCPLSILRTATNIEIFLAVDTVEFC